MRFQTSLFLSMFECQPLEGLNWSGGVSRLGWSFSPAKATDRRPRGVRERERFARLNRRPWASGWPRGPARSSRCPRRTTQIVSKFVATGKIHHFWDGEKREHQRLMSTYKKKREREKDCWPSCVRRCSLLARLVCVSQIAPQTFKNGPKLADWLLAMH